MRRLILFLCAVVLTVAVASSESRFTEVAATATSQTVTINAAQLLIINDSTEHEVYVRVFGPGETTGAATTASTRINAEEGIGFGQTLAVASISIVCASGETATVRLIYW